MHGKEFVLKSISPVVGVNSSETVNNLVSSLGFDSFASLLKPLGFRLTPVTISDIGGNNSQLDSCIRFVDVSGLQLLDIDTMERNLMKTVLPSFCSDKSVGELYYDPIAISKVDTEGISPWFEFYKSMICQWGGASEHETINHPIAELVVVSAHDTDLINLVKKMIFQVPTDEVQFMDVDIPKICLVIDDTKGRQDFDESIIVELNKHLPTTLLNLPLTSSSPEPFEIWTELEKQSGLASAELDANSWSHYFTKTHHVGVEAVEILQNYINSFLAPLGFKNICEKMKQYEKDFAGPKRGLSNRFFKAGLKLFSSSKPSHTAHDGPIFDKMAQKFIFPYFSSVMTLRRLADFAFMVRDFKYAQSIYLLLKKDVDSNEKYSKYYAGVQEMLTLLSLLTDFGPAYEPMYISTSELYSTLNSSLLKVRSGLLIVELMKEAQAFREAAFILPQLATEVVNALRNYAATLGDYEHLGWSLINDHVNNIRGQHCLDTNDYQNALNYLIKLLHRSESSYSTQRGYLSDFLRVFERYSSIDCTFTNAMAQKIPLPLISFKSVQVLHQQLRESDADERSWDSMSADLYHFASRGDQILEALGNPKSNASSRCAVGERITIEFRFENEMGVPLPINNVQLSCQFNSIPVELAPPKDSSNSRWLECDYFQTEVVLDFSLDSAELKLQLSPLMEGKIDVVGVKYLLCGMIPCHRSIPSVATFEISSPMPVLDVRFHEFPKALYNGEIKQVVVEISNKGGQAMKNLWVKSNDAASWRFGMANELDTQIYPSISARDHHSLLINEIGLEDSSIFEFSNEQDTGGALLNPGETTLLPLWIRGSYPGQQNCKLLFLYQSIVYTSNEGDLSILRSVKISKTIDVNPALSMKVISRKSTNSNYARIEVINDCSSKIHVSQISSIGPVWEIDCILNSEFPLVPLTFGPESTATMYMRMGRHRNDYDIAESPEIATTGKIERLLQTGEILKFKKNNVSAKVKSFPVDFRLVVDCSSSPISHFIQESRIATRYRSLQSQYSNIPSETLKQLFPSVWSDDLDIIFFFQTADDQRQGLIAMPGINLYSESALPFEEWISGINLKALLGRSLFQKTHEDKGEFIKSLFKRRGAGMSPLQVAIRPINETLAKSFAEDIDFTLSNNSWMGSLTYDLQINSSPRRYYVVGETSFRGTLPPLEKQIIKIKLVFPNQGTFDINSWRATVQVNARKTTELSLAEHRIDSNYTQYATFPQLVIVK